MEDVPEVTSKSKIYELPDLDRLQDQSSSLYESLNSIA